MNLAQRLSQLEQNRDWQGLVEELERGLQAESDAATKARLHLQLGQVLGQHFLQGAKALRHFQDAYKQNPQLVEALEEARAIYWALGKLNMVQRLLDLEQKAAGAEGPKAAALQLEAGDVFCDLAGDYNKAAGAYAAALGASGGTLVDARESLQDTQVDEAGWQDRLGEILRQANETLGAERGRLYLRAARVARRFAPTEYEGFLGRAYVADLSNKETAALYEGLLAEGQRLDELANKQQLGLAQLDPSEQAAIAFRLGGRWLMRHQNPEQAARLIENSFQAEPTEASFQYLLEMFGTRENNWDRVVSLAENAAQRSSGSLAAFFHAQAGQILWRQVGNLIRARQSFAQLAALAPDHPSIKAFELQIGEPVLPAGAVETPAPAPAVEAPPPAAVTPVTPVEVEEELIAVDEVEAAPAPPAPPPAPPLAPTPSVPPVAAASAPHAEPAVEAAPEVTPEAAPAEAAADHATEAAAVEAAPEPEAAPVEAAAVEAAPAEAAPAEAAPAEAAPAEAAPAEAAPAEAAPAEVAAVEAAPEPVAEAAPEPEPEPDNEAEIAELRATAAKQEGAKRFNEYVKTLIQLASLVRNQDEKIDLLVRAADMYVTKFANQSEAVKVYEQLIEIDPEQPVANKYLIEAYEKRRDWEKLLGLHRREASRMPMGPARTARFLEMAKLASERVRKPEINIDLWRMVLEGDPENVDALNNLAKLYEGARDYESLVGILERQVDITYDTAQKTALLVKLGQMYGDRLNDDEGAVRAWRALLAIDPNERRAQEALKKKYLALGRWDDLEVFYAESGKWDEFIRTLETQESKEADQTAKIGLLMKIAQLYADKKAKLDKAAKSYEKVLELDPKHLAAAEALAPIYAQAQNSKGLAGALEVKLLHETDAHTKLALLREVAALYEEKLKDGQKAFERYLGAFEISAADEQSQGDVERLARSTTRWDDLIAAYRRAIGQADAEADKDLGVALRLRLGRILVDEVGRVDDALVEFRAVYDADGENLDAIAALERLYRQTGRFAELLAIYEKKRDLAATFEEKRETLYAIARLHENEQKDLPQAIATYRAVLDEDPADGASLKALDQLYRQLEKWDSYVEVLRQRIDLETADTELVDLKYRLGKTLEQHMSDPAGALQNYREILFLDQNHEGARLGLEALLTHAELGAEAAAILDPVYELREDWERLIQVLEILAKAELEDSAKRVALLRKVARVASDSLNDLGRAFDASSRALRDDPTNLETRAELEGYAERGNAWDKLDAVFQEIASSLTDAALARDYWMHLGQIDERLGRIDDAASRYAQMLALDPADLEALGLLDQLYRRTERWNDLISVFRKRIDLASDPQERELLFGQMAAVYEEKLGLPEQAIAAYREVLASDEASQLALTALDALFSRQKMWPELAQNLEAQLQLAQEDEAQINLMLRLAAHREERMEQVEQAIEIYRQVLERDAASAAALTAMERLGRIEQHEVPIADILEPLYRQSGDFAKLIGVYEVQVRRSEASIRKVELLHQITQLHEDAAGDLNAAFDTMARALAVDPSHEETQGTLDRLARATGRFKDLARVFEELAAQQQDAALGCALYAMSARVYENDLGEVESAIAHYRTVLSLDATNLDAAESLERLFRHAERYPDLSLILQRKAEILDAPEEKKNSLFQAASIEEDVLNRREMAIAVYQKVLELDPEDLVAIDALTKLFLALSRWEELLGVYGRKVELVVDPDEKKRIYYEQGGVYERELNDVPRAIDTYQKVLEIDPDDLVSLGRLDILYQTSKNWPELLVVLQHESDLALSGDPAESVSFQYRIGELYEKHLGDVGRAVEIYRDILGQQPDHGPTLQALEGLKSGENGADPLPAALVLEPVYEAMGDWARLISALEVQVKYADDAFRKVELLHRIARLYEDSLGDIKAAFDTYARSLPVDNTSEDTLLALERLGSAVEGWPTVASLYDIELGKLADNRDHFVELGLRVAQIYELQLENVDSAVARYRGVLAVDAENQAAVRSLDRLFQQTGRWAELAEILAREAELGQSADEILEFKHRLGELQQTHLNNTAAAIAAYREILLAAPEHQSTLLALEGLFATGVSQVEIAGILEPLYEASGDWEKLSKVYEAQLSSTTDPADRLAMYYRLGELAEEKIGDTSAAMHIFIRALKEQPLDERSGEDVERLAAATDSGWEAVANAYADITGESEDNTVKRTLGKRLARVFEINLGDVNNAEKTYHYVLSVEPLEVEALTELDRICTALEKWPDVAATLEQRVKASTDRTELVELYSRLGETYEVQLGQVDDAIRAYRRIFDELDKANEGAIQALERLYTQKEAHTDLLVVHERELENAVGDMAEADIRAKIATLLSYKLGQVARAIETWKRVLELRGDEPESLGALADLYERESQWDDLTEVLAKEADIAPDDTLRVAALTRRARTFSQKLSRDDQALEDWYRVLDIDYSNVDALRAIADIRRKEGDAHELVRALQDTVERAGPALDSVELVAIFRELGRTFSQTLGQPQDAADAWTRLLSADPTDAEALDSLEAIYRQEERWSDVINVKMQRAEALPAPEEKIRELLEVAGLWEHSMGDKDGGRLAFEKILTIDATHEQAFLALEELHTTTQRWENLIELYLNRLETREVVAEKSDLLRRIARVFDEKLSDRGQAFDALLNSFSEDYYDNETVRYLEKMAQATGRWAELIQSANTWLQGTEDRATKIILSLRLAKWYGEDLGRTDYAQPYFAQVVQLDPNNVAVLRQMASLYRKNQQWQLLGQTLTRALDVAVMDTDRKEILTDLGDVLFNQLKETDQALSFYRRALEVDPHHVPAIEALEKIYTDREQTADLAHVLNQKVPGLKDNDQIVATKLRIGALYEGQLNQPEDAGRVYREVLDLEVSSLTAMKGLERIYSLLKKWPELVGVLEMQLDVVSTERERIETLYKIARVQEEQFLKPELQAQRLEQILEIDPSHEQALEGLARAYTRLRQWHELVNTYERHISSTFDRAKKVELFQKIALVFADELQDADRAIDAYRNIVDIDDANIPAQESLSKLYEKQGDVATAIEYMTRVADLTSDGQQRVEMYYRIGRALDEKLGDRVQAQERYDMALDLNPSHQPTLAALRQISLDSGDWDRASRLLDQEQQITQVPRARAKLLVELGKLRNDMLGEHDLAIQAFEQARQCDADNEDAALPLMEEYVQQQRWQEAEPLVDMLVRKSGKRERTDQHRLYRTQGKVASALTNDDKALKAYQQAVQLDLTDQESIRGLAEVNFRLKDWAGSLTNFQKVLTSLGEEEEEARADIYYRLGCIKREQQQAKQAITNFEKALSLSAGHRATLDALVGIYSDLKDWKQVAEYKRQILDNVIDGDERFKILIEIADVWGDQEKNHVKAVEALEEARDLRPDDHKLLHRMLPLYQLTQNWSKMIDTIQAIMALDSDPGRKSRYLFTLGQLFRDYENDPDRAVDFFNQALDLNPDNLDAFERIGKLLTSQKNWKGLERAYRKMLLRLKDRGKNELEFKLCHDLGIIYRDRLKDPNQAIEAFKLASSKKPEDAQEHQILAELFELTEQVDQAVEQQEEILKTDPTRVEPYRALYRLYLKKQSYDEAWCLAAALSFLRKADDEERKFFDDYKPTSLLPVKMRIDNQTWLRNIFHEDVNSPISKIFEMLAAAALAAKVDLLKAQNKLPNLDPRFLQNPATSTIQLAKTFGWAAQWLALPSVPALYTRSDMAGGIAHAVAQPPAVVAGQAVLSGFDLRDLAFICAKALTLYRGEFFIKTIFTTQTELEVILYSGIKIARPEFALPAQLQQQVMPVAQALANKMQPMQIEVLKQAVKVFFDQGAKVNLKRWMQGAESTAARAALVLSGDLEIARKILQAEPQMPGDLGPGEKIKDLLLYSVSPAYFAARKAIGVNIQLGIVRPTRPPPGGLPDARRAPRPAGVSRSGPPGGAGPSGPQRAPAGLSRPGQARWGTRRDGEQTGPQRPGYGG
jgi:tetratricopeptide (TPR) repeat protein